jgi:hypothetical protein
MSKKKKIILGALLSAAAVVGITSGVAFAQDGAEAENSPGAQQDALLDRVAQIYEDNTGVAIDPEALKDAFIAARDEMMAEALNSRLDRLVEEGVITQQQADELRDWVESRPDVPLPGGQFRGGFGGRGCGGPGGPGGPGFPGGEGFPGDAAETTMAY